MKLIVKGDEPSFFQNWNKSKPSGANWKDFSGTQVYQELRRYLINEQAMLCCYCEIALREDVKAHVEHFKHKDRYPRDMFNIQNLFACCQHNDSCGHKKGTKYFDELISPLDKNCQRTYAVLPVL